MVIIPGHGVVAAPPGDGPSVLAAADELLHVADHDTPGDVLPVKLRLQGRVHTGAGHDVYCSPGLDIAPEVVKLGEGGEFIVRVG